MYISMKEPGVSFDALAKVTSSRNDTAPSFPYAVHAARCGNCRYFKKGKCTLKRCCCMRERVLAHSCSIGEILNDCFSDLNSRQIDTYAAKREEKQRKREENCRNLLFFLEKYDIIVIYK